MLPSLTSAEALAGSVAVVIDILRASTTITHAVAHGAAAVIPCLEVDEARERRAADPEALLGGERGGVPIEGFDLSNSPGDYSSQRVSGKRILFTTTNGTRAMALCRQAQRVFIGCFANRRSLGQLILSTEGPVHLVCAGTDGALTREDVLFAGCMAADLLQLGGPWVLNDEALLALGAWESVELLPMRYGLEAEVEINTETDPPSWLAQALLLSRGGRNLTRLGLIGDIRVTAEVSLEIVPELNLARWEIHQAKPAADPKP